jgi:hypothetical protein
MGHAIGLVQLGSGNLDPSRLKVTNLDDQASRCSLAGSWIELET